MNRCWLSIPSSADWRTCQMSSLCNSCWGKSQPKVIALLNILKASLSMMRYCDNTMIDACQFHKVNKLDYFGCFWTKKRVMEYLWKPELDDNYLMKVSWHFYLYLNWMSGFWVGSEWCVMSVIPSEHLKTRKAQVYNRNTIQV